MRKTFLFKQFSEKITFTVGTISSTDYWIVALLGHFRALFFYSKSVVLSISCLKVQPIAEEQRNICRHSCPGKLKNCTCGETFLNKLMDCGLLTKVASMYADIQLQSNIS
jgi:hypothetical protein